MMAVSWRERTLWVSVIPCDGLPNEEMRAPTVVVSHDGASGCVVDAVVAPERLDYGDSVSSGVDGEKGREGGARRQVL